MKQRFTVLVAVLFCLVGGRVGAADESAARDGCRITGEVLFEGRPVAAAVEVHLRLENPRFPHGFHWTSESVERMLLAPRETPPVAVVRTGADGRFEVLGLAPARYGVVARTDAGAWAGLHVPLYAAGQREEVHLDLRAGTERLRGRLQQRDGTPFRGFVLVSRDRLVTPDWWRLAPASQRFVETDAEGRFRFEGLSRGPARISALIPGRLLQPLDHLQLPFEGELEAVVDEVRHPVAGRVLDIETDEPVAGARVVWTAYGREGIAAGVETTDAEGAYELPAPVAVRALHVRRPGYAERYLDAMGGVGEGTIRIRPGVRITGRVVTADGVSPGAGVLIERRGPGSYWYQWTRTTTDAAGHFTLLDQTPGGGPIYARGLGWVPRGLRAKDWLACCDDLPTVDPLSWWVEPKATIDVPLEVERGASVLGRIVDVADRPVAGVPVLVTDSEDPAYSWEGATLPPTVASAADGTFQLDGLLFRSEYELSARPAGGAPLEAKVITGARGAEAARVMLRLPAPQFLRVRVVDRRSQRAVPGARVQIILADRTDDRTWFTDVAGVARVGPIGPFSGEVDVSAEGFIDANQRPVPTATREGTEVTIAIDPALAIRGRVAWADGTPAPAAIVYGAEISDDLWKTYRGKRACDAEGRFVLEGVNDIDYRLAAVVWRGADRFEATQIVHGGTADVRLTLAPVPKPVPDPAPALGPKEQRPPAARLRVVDPQGRPVPRAEVTGSSRGVEDGEAAFDSMPAAGARILVSGATAEDGMELPLGPLRLTGLPVATGSPPTVTLPAERALEGRVIGPDGSGVGRVAIRAVSESEHAFASGSPRGRVAGTAMSRPDGTFRIGQLEDLPYLLELTLLPGVLAPHAPVRGTPGTPVEIHVRSGVAVPVAVTDPDGRPAPGMTVTARARASRYTWRDGWTEEDLRAAVATTDAEGRARLEGLDPDRKYALEVEPPAPRKDVMPDRIDGWRPAALSVALKPRGVIRGRVVGAAAEHVYVLWRQGGAWGTEFVPREALELVLPVRGEVELLAGPYGLRRPLSTSRIVRARTGDAGVSVPYEPGARLRLRVSGMPPGEKGAVEWALVEEGAAEPAQALRWRGSSTLERTGEVLFEGLDPAARYTASALGAPGGLSGRATGLAAGKGAVVVPLVVGPTIRGTIRAAGRVPGFVVTARPVGGGPAVRGEVEGTRFEIRGLVVGRWLVIAEGDLNGEEASGAVEAEAGESVDLALERR